MKVPARKGSGVDEVLPMFHTGNTVPTLTLKIPKQLRVKLAAAAKRRGITQSALVREAIEASLRLPDASSGPSLFDQMSDLIGVSSHGPPDLSTNKAHLQGLGLDGPARRKLRKAQRRVRDRAR